MPDEKNGQTLRRIRKSRLALQVCRDFVPLVRINAPGIYADRDFQDWLNRVTLEGRPNAPGHRTATWHWPGHEVGEESDVFMVVEYPDGSDQDMPSHCWERIIAAVSAVFDRTYWECVVWLTNIPDSEVREGWVVVRV